MRTSLKKLQKFASHRHDRKAQKHHQSVSLDEHARATQVLLCCYPFVPEGTRLTVFRGFVFYFWINVHYSMEKLLVDWGFRKLYLQESVYREFVVVFLPWHSETRTRWWNFDQSTI